MNLLRNRNIDRKRFIVGVFALYSTYSHLLTPDLTLHPYLIIE